MSNIPAKGVQNRSNREAEWTRALAEVDTLVYCRLRSMGEDIMELLNTY